MIPKIIHQTARTADLTWEELHLKRRLAHLLPGWTVKLWTDEDNRALLKRHFPQHLEAYDAIAKGVIKADIARLVYMHAEGGIYLDTDYKLLRPFDDAVLLQTCVLPIEIGSFKDEEELRLGNSILGSVAGYAFWGDFIAKVFENMQKLATDQSEMSPHEIVSIGGPFALTRFFLARRDAYPDVLCPPPVAFHPNQLPTAATPDPVSYGIHLCWGSWRGKRSVRWLKNQIRRKFSAL